MYGLFSWLRLKGPYEGLGGMIMGGRVVLGFGGSIKGACVVFLVFFFF